MKSFTSLELLFVEYRYFIHFYDFDSLYEVIFDTLLLDDLRSYCYIHEFVFFVSVYAKIVKNTESVYLFLK